MPIDFSRLWDYVIESCPRDLYSVHGPDHWRRVERNGLILASQTPGAVPEIVRLFAIFHDCQRENDGYDPEHGERGGQYAAQLRGEEFDLSDEHFALLQYACQWHTEGLHHEDPTIGCCWDADRLDLGRVGMIPHRDFMSTSLGREIASHGLISPWVHLAEPWLGTQS